MQRKLLGVIAAIILLASGVGWLVAGGGQESWGILPSVGVRVGLVLGAGWLAFPAVAAIGRRVPPWLAGACLIGAIAFTIRPNAVRFIAPVILLLFLLHGAGIVLRPRNRTGNSRPRRRPPGSTP